MATKPTPPAANPAPSAPAKAVEKKSGFIKKITNKIFAQLPLNEKVLFGGVLKSISDSEGNYGTVTKLKGDFAIVRRGKVGDVVSPIETATAAYIPAVVVAGLKSELVKLAAWERVEFVIEISRVETGYSYSFPTLPRLELPRAIALVSSAL